MSKKNFLEYIVVNEDKPQLPLSKFYVYFDVFSKFHKHDILSLTWNNGDKDNVPFKNWSRKYKEANLITIEHSKIIDCNLINIEISNRLAWAADRFQELAIDDLYHDITLTIVKPTNNTQIFEEEQYKISKVLFNSCQRNISTITLGFLVTNEPELLSFNYYADELEKKKTVTQIRIKNMDL